MTDQANLYPDLVVLSMHEKGFPQADFYRGFGAATVDEFEATADCPDAFFTMKRGDTMDQAEAKARAKWPSAKVVRAGMDDPYDPDEDDGDPRTPEYGVGT